MLTMMTQVQEDKFFKSSVSCSVLRNSDTHDLVHERETVEIWLHGKNWQR